ncbi:uncharacterized protein LOC143205297 isoform X1 [Rhynchophorus ferrugineus]|uniref:uncharacterized protein LOC143205297 isoform X1 n=1 Tax=Rhynchophorus ferrugineus TaxID=354439 RepID=UPI003FCC6EA4
MADHNPIFKYCKVLLIFGGVWTLELNVSPFKKKLYNAYSYFAQYFYFMCLFLFIIEFSQVLGKDLEATISNIKSLTFVTTVIAKTVLCQTRQMSKLIRRLFREEQQIHNIKVGEIRNIYTRHSIYCRNIVYVLIISLYFTGILFLSAASYDVYSYKKEYNLWFQINETVAAGIKKPHPIQCWFPFDRNKYYSVAITYELYHITQSLIYNGAAQTLVNSTLIFFRTELQILQYLVKNFEINTTGKHLHNFSEIKLSLKNLTVRYQNIIRWVGDFNDCFQYILLLEYSVISLMLATILIEIYQGKQLVINSLFFVLLLTQLFIMSWNANEIIEQSSHELLTSLYGSNWYKQNRNCCMPIYIMMLRCSRPLSIAIGPFGKLTVDAAVSRVKLAYSVLSLMSSRN